MSLSHGHLYMADKLTGEFGEKVRAAVNACPGAFATGALGPDIMYWADDAKSLHKLVGRGLGDLHVGDTGSFVIHLIQTALKHLRRGDAGAQEFLALALGWMTHWSTDLYIHALVDRYGGQYDQRSSRHLQLELVETKYIHTLAKGQNRTLSIAPLQDSIAMWNYLIDAFRAAYAFTKGMEEENFPGPIACNWAGLAVIQGAFRAAEDACYEMSVDTATPNDYTAMAEMMDKVYRPLLSIENVVDGLWRGKGGVIPSSETYKALLDPIDIAVTSSDEFLDVIVTVRDTGLYGKFLREYDIFLEGALTRAGAIASVVNKYLAFLDTLPASAEVGDPLEEWKTQGYRDELRRLVYDPQVPGGVNILIPDSHWPMLAAERPARAAVLQNARPTAYALNREKIYYELKVMRESGELPTKVDNVPLTPLAVNALFASRSVDAQFRIPIANPEKQIYGYELTVTLDGPEALAEKSYEGVEYKTERNIHLDIGMIHGATAIVVGYQGPVATKRTPEIVPNPKTPVICFPFPMPVPETTIVIDSQKVGANDVIRALSWQADSLVAEIREESDNRPIGSPGEDKKPICGQNVHHVTFKATPDFQHRLVSFEVIETYSSDCHCDDEIYCFDTHQSTCFAATNLPVIDFGDHSIRFGIDDARLLQQHCAKYQHRSTSKAYLSNSNWDLDENLPDKFAAEAKIGFYIEFRL